MMPTHPPTNPRPSILPSPPLPCPTAHPSLTGEPVQSLDPSFLDLLTPAPPTSFYTLHLKTPPPSSPTPPSTGRIARKRVEQDEL